MIVHTDADGYVESYAIIGTIEGGVEVPTPSDFDYFESNFTAYRVRDGNLVFDKAKQKAIEKAIAVAEYRRRREDECFSVINRGQLWYDTLFPEQLAELKTWYRSWLDGTNTLTIPEKPGWLG